MNHPSALSFLISLLFPLPSPEDVLGVLQGVIGRRHPSTAQSRQLKHTLPTLSVVLELLLSQVAWTLWLDFKVLMLLAAMSTKSIPHKLQYPPKTVQFSIVQGL